MSAPRRFPIDASDAGARLDKILVKALPGIGRAGAKKLFDDGKVRIFAPGEDRGHLAAKGEIAPEGGTLEIELEEDFAATGGAIPDPDAQLVVLLETPDIVVVDKPAGQPSAPLQKGERGTTANALVARYPEMAGVGYAPREPGLCHRLDTGTSGLLVAARTRAAFEAVTNGIKEARVDKRYLLLCASEDLPDASTIEYPLASDPKHQGRVLACVHPRDVARLTPKPATTSFTVVRRAGLVALVEVKAPKAARHQIRAHFAAFGHPLLGDTLYGGAAITGRLGHALHASRVTWPGSSTLPAFSLESPLPAELEGLLVDDAG